MKDQCLPEPMAATGDGYIKYEIKLEFMQVDEVTQIWRWVRSDGELVSGEFRTKEAAMYMVHRVPFITDKEWLGMVEE